MQYIKNKLVDYRYALNHPNAYTERLLLISKNGLLCLVFGLIFFGFRSGAEFFGFGGTLDLGILFYILFSYFAIFQGLRAVSTVVTGLVFKIFPRNKKEEFSFVLMILISMFPLVFLVDIAARYKSNKDFDAFDYDVVHKENIIYLFGEIGAGMLLELTDRVISNQPIHTVWIDSVGGSTFYASKIAKIIAKNGYNTRVEAECSSACWDVFAAGERREVDIYAYFGCHRSKSGGILRTQGPSGVHEVLSRESIVASSVGYAENRLFNKSKVDVDNENMLLSSLELGNVERSKIESKAIKHRQALSDSCSSTPHDRLHRASIEELVNVGLVTYVRKVGGEKYLSPKQADWNEIRKSRDFKREQLSVHSQIIRTALKEGV